MATKFQFAIEAVLEGHGLFEKFQNQTEFHVRLEQTPYEPLVIERHGELISVAHYYYDRQGDLIADPDVELNFPDWTPTAIQLSDGSYSTRCFEQDGRQFVGPKFDSGVFPFVEMWAENIEMQRWAKGEGPPFPRRTRGQALGEGVKVSGRSVAAEPG